MDNHLGLAFTSDAITFANFQANSGQRILTHLDKIAYPFQYEENIFFLEENIVRLANLVLNQFESFHIEPSSISISIESNLSLVKRIEIPVGLTDKEEAKHIQWDLTNSLISPLDDYVYLKTNILYDRNSYKEVLVIALRQDIIEFFKSFIGFTKTKLNNLSTNNLATELCFKNAYPDQLKGINLLFKINTDRIESMCMYQENLIMVEYEKIKPISTRTQNEVILEKITNYKKNIENYLQQVYNITEKIDNIYLYGLSIDDSFIALLTKNISTNVSTFNSVNNINLSEEVKKSTENIKSVSGFVESIGITLDSD